MHVFFVAVSVRLYSVCLSVLLFIAFYIYGLLLEINPDDDDDDNELEKLLIVILIKIPL